MEPTPEQLEPNPTQASRRFLDNWTSKNLDILNSRLSLVTQGGYIITGAIFLKTAAIWASLGEHDVAMWHNLAAAAFAANGILEGLVSWRSRRRSK